MKTHQKSIFLAAIMALSLSVHAQDPDVGTDEEMQERKHIKIVKVENGVTSKLDTVIVGNEMPDMEDFNFEEFSWNMEFDSDFPDSVFVKHGKGHKGRRPHAFVIRQPEGFQEIREFKFENGDSTQQVVFVKHFGEDGPQCKFGPAFPPAPAREMRLIRHRLQKDPNRIDLNDAGIISYKKKDLSGGREKIEIIRKKPSEHQLEIETEVSLDDQKSSQ